MSARRVLLVECLDAPGSDRSDARERCAALRALGAVVRVAILGRGGGGPPVRADAAIHASSTMAEWDAGPGGLARLHAFAREGRFDLVLAAAAAPGGGPAARATAVGAPAWWWPTGVARAPGWGARLGLGRAPGLPPLRPVAQDAATPAGLAWSSPGERHPGRGRLTLWDGDYLLAPLPLEGEQGSRLLASFAGLSAASSGVDLVVLSEPQPAFEREARARGVGTRVHFVGPAPREAEWAWWTHASGAVLAGGGPLAGGLVLRGLAAGCPLAVAGRDGAAGTVGRWLAHHGCAPWASPDGEDFAGTLARMLERGVRGGEAVTRGRALAAQHDHRRWAASLAAALPALVEEGPPPRTAAVA